MRSVILFFVFLSGPCFAREKAPIILMETSHGEIEILLFPDIAPAACDNFLSLVSKGFYDGLLFHRIIKGYAIQSGDPSNTGKDSYSSTCKPIPDEIALGYEFDMPGRLGLVSFGPDRNGSQFFITLAATPWLTGKHTLFGQVIRGFKTMKALEDTAFALESATIPSIIRITKKGELHETTTSDNCADPQPNDPAGQNSQ